MARLRTFIAVDIGDEIRDRAVSLQEKLARRSEDVKWVEPKNLHVTMLFLGEVDEREVIDVCRAVAKVTATNPRFSLTIESVGCFPNSRRPRVIWIGAGEGSEELCALHDALEPPLLQLGSHRREERQYKPHITLGRVRSDRPADDLAAALAKNASWVGGTVQVNQLLVMCSQLTPQGPSYSVLSRAKFSTD